MGSVTLKDMIPEDTQVSMPHTGLNNGYGYKFNMHNKLSGRKRNDHQEQEVAETGIVV